MPMKLQILSDSSHLDFDGNMVIVANLKNLGDEKLVNAKVVATYYDASSHVVAAALMGFDPEITGEIDANQTVQFEIVLDKSRAQYVQSYALAVESNQYAMIPEFSTSIILILPLILFLVVSIGRMTMNLRRNSARRSNSPAR